MRPRPDRPPCRPMKQCDEAYPTKCAIKRGDEVSGQSAGHTSSQHFVVYASSTHFVSSVFRRQRPSVRIRRASADILHLLVRQSVHWPGPFPPACPARAVRIPVDPRVRVRVRVRTSGQRWLHRTRTRTRTRQSLPFSFSRQRPSVRIRRASADILYAVVGESISCSASRPRLVEGKNMVRACSLVNRSRRRSR